MGRSKSVPLSKLGENSVSYAFVFLESVRKDS